MCTSFLFRGNDTLIGMNYDNHGMNFEMEPHRPDRFVVSMKSWGKKRALFGVRSDGIFANQQVVDPCEAGKYRLGPHVVHTSQLVGAVLQGKPAAGQVGEYLAARTVVNPPRLSLHCLVADANGQSWVVEPGRGTVCFGRQTRSVVMSNCPVSGAIHTGKWEGFGVDRQLLAQELLQRADDGFTVQDAFAVLKAVQQTQGDWITEFSLVYSARENAVYYCLLHDFGTIHRYQLQRDGNG